MGNPFDQFDAPAQKSGNPFDQFDAPRQPGKAPSGVLRGIRDPIDAAAQMLVHALPDSVVEAGNQANNWIAENTGLVGKLPEKNLSSLVTGQKTGIDGMLQQQEADYQAQRKAAGETGADWGRIGGNIAASLIPGAGATRAAQSMRLGPLAQAAVSGGATSLLTPVLEGDSFIAEKAKQAAGGAVAGSIAQRAISGISRLVSPNASVNPDIQTLMNEGVRITPFQALGGMAKRLEEKARSLPILGDAITAAHRRGGEDLNMAVLRRGIDNLNRAGMPGQVTRGGGEGLQQLRTAAQDAYESLLPRMMADTGEQQFATNMANLRQMVQALPANEARYFDETLNREITQRLAPNGVLSGENLRAAQAALRDHAAQFLRSPDAYQRNLGAALRQADQELRGLIERANPQFSRQLGLINEAYRVMKTAQRAGSSVAAENGVFSPAQLHNAVKAMDRTKDKRAFAEGTAFLQDLSGPGKRVLAQQYPDSGTAGRMFLGGGALASGLASPVIPGTLLAGSAAYIPIIQRLLTGAVASRPQAAQGIAQQMQRVAPYLAAPGAVFGNAALQDVP